MRLFGFEEYDAKRLTESLACQKCGAIGAPNIRHMPHEYLGMDRRQYEHIALVCRTCGAAEEMHTKDWIDPRTRPGYTDYSGPLFPRFCAWLKGVK